MVWVVAVEDDQDFVNYAKTFPTRKLAEMFAVKHAKKVSWAYKGRLGKRI